MGLDHAISMTTWSSRNFGSKLEVNFFMRLYRGSILLKIETIDIFTVIITWAKKINKYFEIVIVFDRNIKEIRSNHLFG